MIDREFKVQVLETGPQWNSGLWRRLKLDANGISLFANPAFVSWLAVENWQEATGDIVTDECGQTYWSAIEFAGRGNDRRRDWSLFRHNPATGQTELLLRFEDCGDIEPRKMWLRKDYLWLLDRGENRALALSRDNFQIVHEVNFKDELIDIDLDQKDVFYALVERQGKKKICPYPAPPRRREKCFELKEWKDAGEDVVALAVGPQGALYLLDAGQGRFIRVNPDDHEEEIIGSLSEGLLKGFVPSAMEIDEQGVIYLATDEQSKEKPARLHLFDEDGSYLGETTRDKKSGEITSWNGIPLPKEVHRIGGIGFDSGGAYLATDYGLAKFSLSVTPVGQDGVYYSKTLDNGSPEGLWHRVALRGRIPERTNVEVFYYASDSTALKAAFDGVLSSKKMSKEEKEKGIENLLGPLWKGPDIFSGTAGRDDSEPDVLALENKGRFLWLKLRLTTFDAGSRPAIRSARIYYPRLSYLRYLPPAYLEDPVSAGFLERFLSLFETVFDGLDQKIDQLHQYFDAGQTPAEFLRWLASWINLSIDEDLPERRVRRLIERAPELYARKGTPAALIEFLEIYTGRAVSLVEHGRGLRPWILGGSELRLGQKTILLGSGVKGFRVGDTSVVGYSALRDRVRDADEPFLPVARRFTILLTMDREEFNQRAATLRRILDEQKPAHTECMIGLMAEQSGAGTAILGISATVAGTQPYRVGLTPLGSASAVAKGPQAMRLERGAWIGSSSRL